jgi:phospholipase C
MADIAKLKGLVDTIVVVMMENRSFDHLLGYLALPRYGAKTKYGLSDDSAWLKSVANPNDNDGFTYPPFRLRYFSIADPPHERTNIAEQIGDKGADGLFPLKGFVDSAGGDSSVMGYYLPDDIPMTAYLAEQFRVCSRWFASLPAGTQPNRLMALSGFSLLDTNSSLLLPDQRPLVYDWLDGKGVPWRVYHDGYFPFITLMERFWKDIAEGDLFRPFENLTIDLDHEPSGTFPRVIFIEPTYTCARLGNPDDNHPPTSVTFGEQFLMRVYNAITSNSDRWKRTVMILASDEHGGFFDHVQPIALETAAPGDIYPVFETSGIRVPAIVISPLVSKGTVFGDAGESLDHTSILKFLGQMFDPGGKYSDAVNSRNVASVADVIDLDAPDPNRGTPPTADMIPQPGTPQIVPTDNPHAQAFALARAGITKQYPHQLLSKHANTPGVRAALGI